MNKQVLNVPKRAVALRKADPDALFVVRRGSQYVKMTHEEALREFCQDRDTYIRAMGKHVSCFVELSAMVPCRKWLTEPVYETPRELLSKQERARLNG